MTLAHLFRELPVVGGVQVTLTEDPYVAYGVNIKAAPGMPALSLNSIPGLQSTIVNALTGIMREHIVFPKSVNVVVASDHTPQTVRAIEAGASSIHTTFARLNSSVFKPSTTNEKHVFPSVTP